MAKKETQQRVLVIKNFKNIGVSQMNSNYNLSDKLEKLVLNTSYKSDHHGGLVTIIGENNTGKSNVSGAIDKFAFKDETTFNENDFPNFSNYEACEPDLNLMLRDYTQAATTNNGGGGAKYVSHTLATIQQQDGEIKYEFCNNKEALKAAIRIYTKTLLDNKDFDFNKVEIFNLSNKAKESKTEKELLAIYTELKSIETNHVEIFKAKERYKNDIQQAYNELLKSANYIIGVFEKKINEHDIFYYTQDRNKHQKQWQIIKQNIQSIANYDKMKQAYKEMQDFIQKVSNEYNERNSYYGNNLPEFTFITPKAIKEQKSNTTKNYENVDEVLEEVFESDVIEIDNKDSLFLPQVFNYNDIRDEFKNDDLIVSLDKLGESRFFQSLFNAINQPMFSVLNAYKKAKTTPAFLSNQERVINERIKNIVTKRVNEIFGKNDNDGYDFEIRLEKHRILFCRLQN